MKYGMQLGCERREDRGGILKYSLRKWLKKQVTEEIL